MFPVHRVSQQCERQKRTVLVVEVKRPQLHSRSRSHSHTCWLRVVDLLLHYYTRFFCPRLLSSSSQIVQRLAKGSEKNLVGGGEEEDEPCQTLFGTLRFGAGVYGRISAAPFFSLSSPLYVLYPPYVMLVSH